MPFYYSLFFNSAGVVGDAFRADFFDDVAQLFDFRNQGIYILFCNDKVLFIVAGFQIGTAQKCE